jgi:hypothetical protein
MALKALVDHISRDGHLGAGACHIHVVAHGYQPTASLTSLLQVGRGAGASSAPHALQGGARPGSGRSSRSSPACALSALQQHAPA